METLPETRQRLSHVRWIGGGSGGAKSTIARRLADEHDAVVYDTDASMADHAARCSGALCPRLERFKRMSMDEKWVMRTPQDMLESFHWFAGEGFHLILEDLLALPRDRPVIAEGFRLLPRLVAPLISNRRDAVWLLPTSVFRRIAFDARGTTWIIPNKTSQPERALANILMRDQLFTDKVQMDVRDLDLGGITVDGTLDEDTLTRQVSGALFEGRSFV